MTARIRIEAPGNGFLAGLAHLASAAALWPVPQPAPVAETGGRVALFGRPEGTMAEVATWLRRDGVAIAWARPAPDLLASLAADRRIGLALIDLDAMGGILAALESLLVLRRSRPDLPVILVSRGFLTDDFDLERLPLCDASLRAPVRRAVLEFALSEAAEVNNPIWVSRQAEACGSRAHP